MVDTLVPDVALLAGMAAVTAALDWRLTLVSVAVIPLYAMTARMRNRQAARRAAAGQATPPADSRPSRPGCWRGCPQCMSSAVRTARRTAITRPAPRPPLPR